MSPERHIDHRPVTLCLLCGKSSASHMRWWERLWYRIVGWNLWGGEQ